MTSYPTRFSLTVLGSNSALPANGRHPSSQILNVNNHYYLIDCGEGTQMQLRRFGLKMQRIKCIFISHMHGDHYFGLIGMLNSLHLLGRTLPLHIYAPQALKPILDLQLDAAGGKLMYPIKFVPLNMEDDGAIQIYEDAQVTVNSFPLKHRIKCRGFLFTEKQRERTYLPELGGPAGVKLEDIPRLKKGIDIIREDGSVLRSADFTVPPPPIRSFAYCTDTLPLNTTASFVQRANLLYHEATFLEAERARSKDTYHSTAKQAAEVARQANVKQLMIGHYSARYDSLEAHLSEATSVFENTVLAREGQEIEIY